MKMSSNLLTFNYLSNNSRPAPGQTNNINYVNTANFNESTILPNSAVLNYFAI